MAESYVGPFLIAIAIGGDDEPLNVLVKFVVVGVSSTAIKLMKPNFAGQKEDVSILVRFVSTWIFDQADYRLWLCSFSQE